MKSAKRWTALTLLALLPLAAACSGTDSHQTPGAADAPPAADSGLRLPPVATLPIPGQERPADAGAPGGGPRGGLDWKLPEGWIPEEPASSLRLAQYRVEGPGGAAECIVFYFGPGQGGDAMSNAARWAGQFEQPDGSDSSNAMQVSELGQTNVPVLLVEVTGTYDGGMTMTAAPPEKKTGYMLLGAVAEGPDAPWFFKFTGPETTVRAQQNAFVSLLRSLRAEG